MLIMIAFRESYGQLFAKSMKICPRCRKTYSDDNLNFCLEDGSVLDGPEFSDLETIQINQTRMTQPQSVPHPGPAQAPWGGPQQQAAAPRKSSKAWVWVLLILGAVVLLCGGGLLVRLAFIGSQANNAANLTASNGSSTNKNSAAQAQPKTSDRNAVTTIDLELFVKESSPFGTTALENGELTMGAKKKGFYYVLVAPEDYKTEDADTRVTLRNIDDAAAGPLGYGLIFHSNPKPLQQGYAFLIDTKKRRYRVVNHSPSKESSVITWTSANAVKGGTEENTLEVRDLDDKIELYINGTMVNSIQNLYGYPGGVVGLYAGNGVKIAFKDLEIRK